MTLVNPILAEALRNRYVLERELGRGGMATVYLARDLRHDRSVAIKVMHPELAQALGPERFLREIRVTARMDHPHILPVLDSGETAGQLWYTMPYVEGESLRDRLRREVQLSIEEAVGLARGVADALGYAHEHGIVHRDIKPENILLSRGHARVADFGVARAVEAAGGGQLTETGLVVGTPLYMSPEQAAGGVVGPTSDIYSLGCVLYEMLAGHPPFTGTSARQVTARHALEQVPSLQVVRDTVPDEIEDAVMAALSKVPADRPQSAAAFAELLERAHGPTHRSARVSRASQASRASSGLSEGVLTFNARRSSLVKALLAAGLAVVLLAVLGWYIAHRPPAKRVEGAGVDPHNIAVLYLEDRSARHELRYLADGLTEDLITALRSVPRLSVISKAGVREYRGRAVDKDSIARALRVGTIVTGSVEPENDSIRATIRLFDDAGVEIERATFKKSGKDLIALSDSLAQEAGVLIRKWIGTEVQLSRTRAGTQNTGSWAMYQHALLARYRGDSLYEVGDAAGFSRAYSVADSLAAVAERLDPQWPDPIVLRGILEYWRSRRAFDDPGLAKMAIDDGLGHAERALALDQKNFDALELRGNLKYYRWLFPLEPDSAKRDLLIASARTDLERAKQLNPNQASAYAMLSHLYANLPDKTLVDVILAASQALDKDAYLSNADVIMLRLSLASYDLGHFPDADRWCREGQRRFPKDYRFVECELLIMTSKFADADRRTAPERAWKLADSVVRLTSDERERRFQQLNVRVLVAGVLARAGLIDSARRVLRNTRYDPELDPSRDLANTAAFVWTLAGDTTEAINNIKAYLVANPSRRADFRDNPNWWFRGLMNDPRYREVVGMAR